MWIINQTSSEVKWYTSFATLLYLFFLYFSRFSCFNWSPLILSVYKSFIFLLLLLLCFWAILLFLLPFACYSLKNFNFFWRSSGSWSKMPKLCIFYSGICNFNLSFVNKSCLSFGLDLCFYFFTFFTPILSLENDIYVLFSL